MTHTLYYTPSACSLSPHIALREAALPFELVRVDLRAKTIQDGDWLAINPKGYVPALRLPDGDVLTEGAVMVQYIADQRPERGLAPPAGSRERLRLQEQLHFIATELHKGMSPLYSTLANADFKEQIKNRVLARFALLAKSLGERPYLFGEHFTVADGYAFYVLHAWQHAQKHELPSPALAAYYQRLAARPAVTAALAAEGIKA